MVPCSITGILTYRAPLCGALNRIRKSTKTCADAVRDRTRTVKVQRSSSGGVPRLSYEPRYTSHSIIGAVRWLITRNMSPSPLITCSASQLVHQNFSTVVPVNLVALSFLIFYLVKIPSLY